MDDECNRGPGAEMNKCATIILIACLTGAGFAATRDIVPNADGEGKLGKTGKRWEVVMSITGAFDIVTADGTNLLLKIQSIEGDTNQFFRINGTLGMTGDINAGGQRLTNAVEIILQETGKVYWGVDTNSWISAEASGGSVTDMVFRVNGTNYSLLNELVN